MSAAVAQWTREEAAMERAVVVLDEVSKRFVVRRGLFAEPTVISAVDAVSLAVRPGETLSIVGESGCGKSTLGRLMLRLLEPSEGRIAFEGRDITKAGPAELRALRRRMQLVFQDPFSSLNPRLTVGAILAEPLWVHGLGKPAARRERVAELLRLVGLDPQHAERYPHEFSGGQRQRIAIARALSSGPTFLVGDEPVSALDVSIQAQIVNLLEDLKARLGLTLVMIAHDLAVIRHVSQRVAVMYLGQLVELAPVDALFEAPLHPYSQALLTAIPVPDPAARRERQLLAGDVPSPAKPPSGCRFHTRCPHARERCRLERPKLEAAAGERTVACHFWQEIAAAASSAPLVRLAAPKPAKARRLALYGAWRARQGDAETTMLSPGSPRGRGGERR